MSFSLFFLPTFTPLPLSSPHRSSLLPLPSPSTPFPLPLLFLSLPSISSHPLPLSPVSLLAPWQSSRISPTPPSSPSTWTPHTHGWWRQCGLPTTSTTFIWREWREVSMENLNWNTSLLKVCSWRLPPAFCGFVPCAFMHTCTHTHAHTGQCFDATTDSPTPGLEYVLGTASQPERFDTIVMANLGYFQLKAAPGAWMLRLREGRSSEIYTIARY